MKNSFAYLSFCLFILALYSCVSSKTSSTINYKEFNFECEYNGNLSPEQRMARYPFNKATKVQIISFTNGSTPIENDTIITLKTKECINLDSIQIHTLTDILYNYNYTNVDTSAFYRSLSLARGVRSACYYPRHAFIFLDEKDKVMEYLEICFECSGLETNLTREETGQFCWGKYDLLKNFIKSNGIIYFGETMRTDIELR